MKPILATDLDGTLIPLELMVPADPSPPAMLRSDMVSDSLKAILSADLRKTVSQREALAILRRLSEEDLLEIIFVTGRHKDSVISVISAEGLPNPQWIICDVGTTILRRTHDQRYHPVGDYVNHLDKIVSSFSTERLKQIIHPSDDLTLQEDVKQGRFKLSFYCSASRLEQHVAALETKLADAHAPYRIISSVDPFNGDGLIDLLPAGTDKSSALMWWATFQHQPYEKIVFAGDSGNDHAALTAGFRCILVGNADRQLADSVLEHHRLQGTMDRFYLAAGHATAGVLEGCYRYGLLDNS